MPWSSATRSAGGPERSGASSTSIRPTERRSRSRLERRFLTLLDDHDLPRPKINRRGDHGELDATWQQQKLIVECDGFAAHGMRKAFEEDRARDRARQVDGWRVLRITWRQLDADGDTIAGQLKVLLGA